MQQGDYARVGLIILGLPSGRPLCYAGLGQTRSVRRLADERIQSRAVPRAEKRGTDRRPRRLPVSGCLSR